MRSRSGNASIVSITVINPGVIFCVCGRLMTTDSAENRKYISSLSTHSPYRASTFEKTDHVVTGMEKLQDAKNTIRHINLQRNAVKGDMKASTTGTSVTRPSGGP